MNNYVLGLDLGPNSIGWATLAARVDDCHGHWNHEVTGFLDTSNAGHPPLGVRVFEAGLAKLDTAKEASLCQKRREARSARRNHQRRNARRREIRRILRDRGLLPLPGPELFEVMKTDAYALRAKALDSPLSASELGRTLLHLAQRRGFKSNRKSGKANEDRGMLKEIGELAKDIEASGARTLGEFFYLCREKNASIRVRAIHTRRNMYEDEFDKIIQIQKQYHPQLDDKTVEEIRHFIFFQHPFELTEERRQKAPSRANLHRAPSVKHCPLEPKERCCHKGLWLAQEFRTLKEINNLKLSENSGLDRHLTKEERRVVLSLLRNNDKRTFDQLRKELHKECGVDPEAVFNLERGDRSSLLGNTVEDKLRKAFRGKAAQTAWKDLDEEIKIQLRIALVLEEDDVLIQALVDAGLSDEAAVKLASWAPQDGYLAYSEKALHHLVPALRNGKNEYEAIASTYPNRAECRAFKKLPPLNSKELPADLRDITNPLVRRALVEVRKVVNALVREHGKPARIVVEMARNMKEGPEQRKKTSKKFREQQVRRENARIAVGDLIGSNPSRSDVNRYLIWAEQDKCCLYTGKPIPQCELFHGEWEIDHILPRWQSLDDSYANKVLVHRSKNSEKGDRTVLQWLGPDSQEFRQLIQRAESWKIPYGKLSRLKQASVDADGFAQRQLNDTRYITKAVVKYLELLYEPELRNGEKAVQSTRGSLTAELRRRWDLNGIIPPLTHLDGSLILAADGVDKDGNPLKSRADHRHHAVDALVVALSSRAYLKRYQDYWKSHSYGDRSELPQDSFSLPWNNFRLDTGKALAKINVSHRVMRKLSGALHEETFFGQACDGRGQPISGSFTTRKKVEAITSSEHISEIRSLEIQHIIREKLMASGWDGKSKSLPKEWWTGGIRHHNGNVITKVRILKSMNNPVPLGDKNHRFAVGGNNHHISFWETPTESGSKAMRAVVVPMRAAAKRAHQNRASAHALDRDPVQRVRADGLKFLMSLTRKESVLVGPPEDRRLAVVQKLSGKEAPATGFDLYFRDARDSRPAAEGNRKPLRRLTSFRPWPDLLPVKVQVDPLGRILPAND